MDVASIIGVLLSKDRTECSGVMMNAGEHKEQETVCQYRSLGEWIARRRQVDIQQ
jgi:hypothetical protein